MSGLIYELAGNITCRSTNNNLKMLFDRERGVMYEMNETASSVIALLEESPKALEDIVHLLIDTYDENPEDIKNDVQQFLSDFLQAGLLITKSTEV